MAHKFSLTSASLKRKFAVYVVLAKGSHDTKLYVGKTGDDREGCNPLISRCGNHFSYNKIHSQIRNKIDDHELRSYTYIFDHFDDYVADKGAQGKSIDRLNKMERWLNLEVQRHLNGNQSCALLNVHKSAGYLSAQKKEERRALRTPTDELKINEIIAELKRELAIE